MKESLTKYNVMYVFREGNIRQLITYRVEIKCLTEMSKYDTVYEINRTTPVYINGEEPDLVVDELAFETGKTLYPIQIISDANRGFNDILNYDEITKRWQSDKHKIKNYFIGEEVDTYLSLMDESIESKPRLIQMLKKDLFFAAFFVPDCNTHSAISTKEMGFPIAGVAKNITFEVNQESSLADDSITIIHNGAMNDERSITDIEREYDYAWDESAPPAKGHYQGQYLLDANTKLLKSATLQWTLDLSIKKSIELQFFQYGQQEMASSVLKEKEEKQNDKSFWADLREALRGKNEKNK